MRFSIFGDSRSVASSMAACTSGLALRHVDEAGLDDASERRLLLRGGEADRLVEIARVDVLLQAAEERLLVDRGLEVQRDRRGRRRGRPRRTATRGWGASSSHPRDSASPAFRTFRPSRGVLRSEGTRASVEPPRAARVARSRITGFSEASTRRGAHAAHLRLHAGAPIAARLSERTHVRQWCTRPARAAIARRRPASYPPPRAPARPADPGAPCALTRHAAETAFAPYRLAPGALPEEAARAAAALDGRRRSSRRRRSRSRRRS